MAKQAKKAKAAAAPQKVVSLTVHKNTLAKRRRAECGRDMRRCASSVSKHAGLAGYVVVGILESGDCEVFYDCGPIMTNLLPMYVQDRINTAMLSQGEEEQRVS